MPPEPTIKEQMAAALARLSQAHRLLSNAEWEIDALRRRCKHPNVRVIEDDEETLTICQDCHKNWSVNKLLRKLGKE